MEVETEYSPVLLRKISREGLHDDSKKHHKARIYQGLFCDSGLCCTF